jgi:hypothetical protein
MIPPASPLEIDVGEAFSFLIKSKEGRSLLLSGGLLYLCFFLIVPVMMAIGYPVVLARAISRSEPVPQPWKLSHGRDGLRFMGVSIVYLLPVIVLLFLLFFLHIVSAEGSGGSFNMFTGPFLAVNLLSQIYFLVIAGLNPAFITILATTGRMRDCFSPNLIRSLISKFR